MILMQRDIMLNTILWIYTDVLLKICSVVRGSVLDILYLWNYPKSKKNLLNISELFCKQIWNVADNILWRP